MAPPLAKAKTARPTGSSPSHNHHGDGTPPSTTPRPATDNTMADASDHEGPSSPSAQAAAKARGKPVKTQGGSGRQTKNTSSKVQDQEKWHSDLDLPNDLSRCGKAAMAAYLGFQDTADLIKLARSSIMLYAVSLWNQFAKGQQATGVIGLLLAAEQTGQGNRIFTTSLDDAVQKYHDSVGGDNVRLQDKKEAQHTLQASILYHVARLLTDLEAITTLNDDYEQEFLDMVRTIDAKAKLISPPPRTTVKLPELGPIKEYGEDMMEKYSRVYSLIRWISNPLTPSNWSRMSSLNDAIYNKDKGRLPYRREAVTEKNIPPWMKVGVRGPSQFSTKALLHQAQQANTSTWTLKRVKNGTIDDEEVDAHLESIKKRKMPVPPMEVPFPHDIEAFHNAAQLKDHIRRLIGAQEARVDLASVEFNPEPIPGQAHNHDYGQGGIYLYNSAEEGTARSLLQCRQYVKDRDATQWTIRYSLCLWDGAENEEYPWEYDGPPFSVAHITPPTRDTPTSENKRSAHAITPQPGNGDEKIPKDGGAASDKARLAEQMLDPDSVNLSGIQGMPTPRLLFPDSVEERDRYHSGYATDTPEAIRIWQDALIQGLPLRRKRETKSTAVGLGNDEGDEVLRATGQVQQEQKSFWTQGELDEDKPAMVSFDKIMSLMGSTDALAGPNLNLCIELLRATPAGYHDAKHTIQTYHLNSLPECPVNQLPNQVTAIPFMVTKAYGFFPFKHDSIVDTPETEARMQSLADSIKCTPTHGGFAADKMGLGKTIEELNYIAYLSIFMTHHKQKNPDPKWKWRPHLLVCPAGVVLEQFKKTIQEKYKGILRVITAQGDRPVSATARSMHLSANQMAKWPRRRKQFPSHLQYILDGTDPMAFGTIVLTSYETWAERTLKFRPSGKKDRNGVSIEEYYSDWEGMFETVILDEGHRVRNPYTNTYKSIEALKAPVHWIATGTPIQNNPLDLQGPLKLLWRNIKRELHATPARKEWMSHRANFDTNTYDCLRRLEHYPAHSWQHLIAGNPEIMGRLTTSSEPDDIRTLFRYWEEMFVLKRSTESSLPIDDEGNRLSLKELMPPVVPSTMVLEYEPNEAAEMQWWHRNAAWNYDKAMQGYVPDKAEPTSNKKKDHPPPVTRPLREMCSNTHAVMESRLRFVLKQVKKRGMRHKDTVEYIEELRRKGFTAIQLAYLVARDGEDISTGESLLRLLSFGAPKLRALLKYMNEYCLDPRKNKKDKILILEDIPMSAFFTELICKMLYIRVEVLHSGLSADKRLDLIKEFNDPNSDLRGLILMYNVSSQGANLDVAAHRVFIMTTAINMPMQEQACARLMRVSQTESVYIIKAFVENSHDAWRESKQLDKCFLEILVRIKSDESYQLIADALNKAQDEVRKAHSSRYGRQVLGDHKTLLEAMEDPDFVDVDDQFARIRKSYFGSIRSEDDQELHRKRKGRSLYAPQPTSKSKPYIDDSDEDTDSDEEATDNIPRLGTLYNSGKSDYRSLTLRERENWEQANFDLQLLLCMDPDFEYTGDWIKRNIGSYAAERGIRLLLANRSGQARYIIQVTPHVAYNALHIADEASFDLGKNSPEKSKKVKALLEGWQPKQPTPQKKPQPGIEDAVDVIIPTLETDLPSTTSSQQQDDTNMEDVEGLELESDAAQQFDDGKERHDTVEEEETPDNVKGEPMRLPIHFRPVNSDSDSFEFYPKDDGRDKARQPSPRSEGDFYNPGELDQFIRSDEDEKDEPEVLDVEDPMQVDQLGTQED